MFIQSIHVRDARFELEPGQGSDAVHSKPEYSFAVALVSLAPGYVAFGAPKRDCIEDVAAGR